MRMIDADELMKAMYHRAFETASDTMWQSGCWVRYRAIEQVVKEMPTIEKRKNGKWIRGDAEKLTGSQRCSICHKACYKGNDYFNYCPNCGADMRGET